MSQEATPQGYHIDMGAMLGLFFMFGVCFLVASAARGRWWGYIGHGLYLALLVLVYKSGFSRSDYEKERKNKCPALTRSDYVQANLLLFALLPTLAWFGLMLPMFLRGWGGRR